jgi:hypothetical protein
VNRQQEIEAYSELRSIEMAMLKLRRHVARLGEILYEPAPPPPPLPCSELRLVEDNTMHSVRVDGLRPRGFVLRRGVGE